MEPFQLSLPSSVQFGRGTAPAALDRLVRDGAPVLLVRGSAPFADTAEAALGAAGLLSGVLRGAGEPDLPRLEAALADARDRSPGRVLGIGGGSVIDLAKAIAALVPQSGAPLTYLEGVGEGRALEQAPLPVTAMPTTAGTGAEVTRNAVIGVPSHGRKVSLRDPRMVPEQAVVDPGLLEGCPRGVLLASGLDAVVQVIEPYLSRKANPWTDAISFAAIERGLAALRRLMDGDGDDAFDDMAFASLCGGLALANSGLGAVHGLAGVLGGRTGQAHGVICGRLLVPILRANAAAGADPQRVSSVLSAIGAALDVPEAEALDGLAAWIEEQGLERLVWEDEDAAAAWVSEAQQASSMKGNPVSLSDAALLDAVRAASTAGQS
ncbi:iron-containing alcohol dehydrogenase [Cognatishimia sp. F0-27]|uniref:iron-containing alcohol dehydrogenase n=1 Tax=Cognatishimia sp. F0-27 TaxID=2816855 RepID=UPI001D0C616F|nr:iron-containing alcohol dehydrogenase [Cognatishimia sp. F0-27]MCC1492108.1 iron-containing alcohol dehydrogenase [Cognatishimia sp. F0-27]